MRPPPKLYQELWDTIISGQLWQGEIQNCRKNGELFWERAYIAPVNNEMGEMTHYLAVKEDITLQKKQEERIIHQANYDSLTNLPNRFLTLDRLSQLIKEANRIQQKAAVFFLDLDDFKKINDSLSHEIGDRLLVQAARRLRDLVRIEDTVSRLGGDEFIVLGGNLNAAEDARPIAEKLLKCFDEPFLLDGRELVLTASIGIAVFPDDGDSSTTLLRNADTAMYYSKDRGRNTYSFYTDAMNQDISRRLQLEELLHNALERNEFYVLYQPLVDVGSRKIIGAEALLRWKNPVLGEVSPHVFIPITEQTGQILPLGKFVLNEALAMTARWRQFDDFIMSVNISPRQFRDPDFVQYIGACLEKSRVPGESLELEITEGILMGGYSFIEEALASLNSLGVGLTMDDFGTGYSSLSYLRNYPFSRLKIDRSFVNGITDDSTDRELVNATIAMAHGLGLKVVAEGVQTKEQLEHLARQGCDIAQGFYFSKPVPPDEMTEMLGD